MLAETPIVPVYRLDGKQDEESQEPVLKQNEKSFEMLPADGTPSFDKDQVLEIKTLNKSSSNAGLFSQKTVEGKQK